MAVSIFIAETFIMLFLVDYLSSLPLYMKALIDALVLTSIVVPLIYFLFVRSVAHLEPPLEEAVFTPLRFSVVVTVLIFFVETYVMLILPYVPPLPASLLPLLDAALLTLLISPLLYFFMVKPLTVEVRTRRRVEEELRKAHDDLEERVRERTADLSRAQEIAHLGSWKMELTKGEMEWSDELYRILEAVPGKNRPSYDSLLAKVHDDDRAMVEDAFKAALKEQRPYEIAHRLVMQNGEVRHVYEKCEVTCDEEGRPTYVTGTVQDISERMRVMEEVRESQQRLKAILDNSTAVIYLKDREGRYLIINRRYEELFHLKQDDIVGKSDYDFFPDDVAALFRTNDLRVISEKKPVEFEEEVPHDDGNHHYISIKFPIFDTAGEVSAIWGISTDITERKLAEGELINSEGRLRAVLETVGEGTVTINSKGVIVMVNREIQNIWGYEQEYLIGRNVDILMPYHYRKLHGDGLKRFVESGVARILGERLEFEGLRRDGSTFPLEICIKETMIENELFFTAALRDISDRKEDEKERERLQTQLFQAQKREAIGTLAAGVAHDFNNLLTTIIGYTELALLKLDEEAPTYKELSLVKQAGNRAADLTRQLLLYSRKQAMVYTVFNINDTVERLLKMIHRLIGENIVIETSLAPDLSYVKADEGNIEQVLMNLAVNGRDAMSEGGRLTITTVNRTIDGEYCESSAYAVPGSFIKISVSDTGTGMDEETIQHIFEPFFTTKGLGKGTGLGMSVVYGIVRKHKGWIDVASTAGEGTTFDIYLPACQESVAEVEEESESLEECRGSGERILLVEDEEGGREYGVTILEANGYRVTEADSAEEAISIFEREKGAFDLIFSDVVLPGQDGVVLVNELLAIKADLKVLMCSGYTDDKSQWSVMQERGYPFLHKPYTIADLLKTVSAIVRT